MALNKADLTNALMAAFDQGMNDPAWTKADAAKALADAIDAFVRTADVNGVMTEVKNTNGIVIGHGTQNNTGTLT